MNTQYQCIVQAAVRKSNVEIMRDIDRKLQRFYETVREIEQLEDEVEGLKAKKNRLEVALGRRKAGEI